MTEQERQITALRHGMTNIPPGCSRQTLPKGTTVRLQIGEKVYAILQYITPGGGGSEAIRVGELNGRIDNIRNDAHTQFEQVREIDVLDPMEQQYWKVVVVSGEPRNT